MRQKNFSGKLTTFVLVLAGLVFFCSSALAQVNYIYKWLQPYDLVNGVDIPSYYDDVPGTAAGIYNILADDWNCLDDRPVTDIHWWGSYWEIDANGARIPYVGETDPYAVMGTSPQFEVKIYKDIPAGTDGINYSRPGEMVWSKPTAFMGSFVGHEQNPIMDNASKFAWHWILDMDDWFRQEPGENVYWLSIYQIFREGDRYLWGWETTGREYLWNDDAVVWDGTSYRPIGDDVGLAFGLTTVPIPGAAWLLASGLLGLIGCKWRRKKV